MAECDDQIILRRSSCDRNNEFNDDFETKYITMCDNSLGSDECESEYLMMSKMTVEENDETLITKLKKTLSMNDDEIELCRSYKRPSLSHEGSSQTLPPISHRKSVDNFIIKSRTIDCNQVREDSLYVIMDKLSYNPIQRGSIICLEIAQNFNYNIPEFDNSKEPLPELCTEIPRISDVLVPEKLDIHIGNVLKLRHEIQSLGGLLITLTKEHLNVMDVTDDLWICKVKNDIGLIQKVHVGDKILEINNKQITNKAEYICYCKCEELKLRIQRLPNAKVFAMTNEVLKSSYHGHTTSKLFTKKKFTKVLIRNPNFTIDENSKDPWILTEVNFSLKVDPISISVITSFDIPYHMVILHQNSFLKKIKFFQ